MATDDIHLTGAEEILTALQCGKVGVWRWKVGSDELRWSSNLETIHDLPAGIFDGTIAAFTGDIHAEDVGAVWDAINATAAEGGVYSVTYRTAPPDGSEPTWIHARGGRIETPEGVFLTGVCTDISESQRTQRELQRRLQQQQAIGRLGSLALSAIDLSDVLQTVAETAAEVLGVPMSKILQLSDLDDRLIYRAGTGWGGRLAEQGAVAVDEASQAGYALLTGEPLIVADLRKETRFRDDVLLINHKVRSGMSAIIAGNDQRPFGVLGVHTPELRDFDRADADFLQALANIIANSVRHASEAERRQLLIREMAHRSGNMLQLVSSIFNQTFRPGVDAQTAGRSFLERLGALGRANFLIASGGWVNTRFTAIVDEVLSPFADRYTASGRDLLLPPELSFDLSLVLHELASNSAKYGAFAGQTEQAQVSWLIVAGETGTPQFLLRWEDPVVSQVPASGTGFGGKLLALLIEKKWGGTIEVELSDGYRFVCTIPLP